VLNRRNARLLFAGGIALVVLGGLLNTRPWAWPWGGIGAWTARNAALIGIGLPGLAAMTIAVVALRRTAPDRPSPGPSPGRRPWLLSYPGITTAAAVVAVVGIVALVAMLTVAGSPATERAKLQIDAIKWGIGLFAAAGAVAALLLNLRRQQHTEAAQVHTERDAAERRLTEIYTKAVEQLGHEKAAVRLGGLRALERVGQDNPKQRQIIVDVICAYLRMPYIPPEQAEAVGADPNPEMQQEWQVRLTAEKIVTDHLRLPPDLTAGEAATAAPDPEAAFWPGIAVNLRGAVLTNMNLFRCHVDQADFGRAWFLGSASFARATFTGNAYFADATFTKPADFAGASFRGGAHFRRTEFTGRAGFVETTFHRMADFEQARFPAGAAFTRADFRGHARFVAATSAELTFAGARFRGPVDVERTADLAAFAEDTLFALPRPPRERWPAGYAMTPGDQPDWGRLGPVQGGL
jgi:hypothetical protein